MKFWLVHFDSDFDSVGDNTFHTTEDSARIYYRAMMIHVISDGDKKMRADLENLTDEQLEDQCYLKGFYHEREIHEFKSYQEGYNEHDI